MGSPYKKCAKLRHYLSQTLSMIKELLLTLLVLMAAVFYVRHKAQHERRQALAREARQTPTSRTPMIVALSLVFVTLAISGMLYYAHWQEAHRLYTVQVTNTHSGEVRIYHVYQDDIAGRSFRTIDGRLIHLSNSERMEVQEGSGDE